MSRSIHTTRRHLAALQRSTYADARRQEREIARLRDQLERKRAIKRHIRGARSGTLPCVPVADIEDISVRVEESGGAVYFPASAEDLRAVMRRLPPGTVDGLREVVLCLGKDHQEVGAEDDPDEPAADVYDRDPSTGRLGWEMLPGVFSGRYLGTYFAEIATIHLYGYVVADGQRDSAEFNALALWLRLQMLGTSMHEIAHHASQRTQGTCARWLTTFESADERNAERRAFEWTRTIVVPYLEQRGPAAVDAFVTWMARHAGVSVPLGRLVDDPGNPFFPASSAIEALAREVAHGSPQSAMRLVFARELHYCELYEEALAVLATVPLDDSRQVTIKALTLQADIHEHLGRYAEAERLAHAALERDAECRSAWQTLADIYHAQGDWPRLEAAASRLIELHVAQKKSSPTVRKGLAAPINALIARARARIELSDNAGAEADISALERIGSRIRKPVPMLRALLALRQGAYTEAMRIARSALQRRQAMWRAELTAVRYEAALALGRRDEAGRLHAMTRRELRERGYGAWVDRLDGMT